MSAGADIRVVGGGVAGLTASIAAAETGASVELFEASASLGGRARTKQGEFRANLGPHVIYADGESWRWLESRGLLPEYNRSPLRGVRFLHEGRLRRMPPSAFVKARALKDEQAPVDEDFHSWAARVLGDEAAGVLSRAAAAITFDHDPGRLSAEFVRERSARVFWSVPSNRYMVGGWQSLVDSLERRARELGVNIHTRARVDELPERPVIVAVALEAARKLLDEELPVGTTRCALLDLGVRERRGDPFIVVDIDGTAWLERYSAADESLAPEGHDLIQGHVGIAPGETPEDAIARLEASADVAFPDWRERTVWRRQQTMDGLTGAIDLPGEHWRDRPAVDRGDGVFLAGDYVAAPGLLSEVAFASALEAAEGGVAACGVAPARS